MKQQIIEKPQDKAVISDPPQWYFKIAELKNRIIKSLKPNDTAYPFTVENIPFLYQSERYSIAWGIEHKGLYVDPYGLTYKYKLPTKWNFCDEQGFITPEKLFFNLSNTSKRNGLFGTLRKNIPINEMVIEDLKTSEIEDSGHIRCDAGNQSNVLLVYDTSIQLYKRIVLTNTGENDIVNKSIYTNRIVDALGEV